VSFDSQCRVVRWHDLLPSSSGVYDGAQTRRAALVEVLRSASEVEVLDLATQGRWSRVPLELHRLLGFIRRAPRGSSLVFFYPDFPFFHPPSRLKLPLCTLLLRLIWRAGRKLRTHLDVVDLPRWQCRSLGYTLRLDEVRLRQIEANMFASFQRVTLPSASMAKLVEDDLGISCEKLVVLPNGLPARDFERGKPLEGSPSYVYAGDLSRKEERSLGWLIELFLEHASPDARLHLCGPGGDWLHHERVVYHGNLAESAALELVSRADFALVPYPEEGYYHLCFPSKLGLYVAAATPIVTTNITEAARFVSDTGVGVVRTRAQFSTVFSDPVGLEESFDRGKVRARCRSYRWGPRVLDAILSSSSTSLFSLPMPSSKR